MAGTDAEAGAGAEAGAAPLDETESWEWEALVRPGRRIQPGTELLFDTPPARVAEAGSGEVRSGSRETQAHPRLFGRVVGRTSTGGRRIVFRPGQAGETFTRIIAALGQAPLPPYITQPLADPERYQTIFARVRGSAAAPTAGLHFTPRILESLRMKGVVQAMVTLHIGLDTFRPVREEEVENHRMHSEWYDVPPETAHAIAACRARGGQVVACGTTVVRTLESAAVPGGSGLVRAGSDRTPLFICPGYSFRAVDAILTNFHLPRSTLLMLVSAFGGRERVLAAYEEAARLGYRFYSLGDAMLVFPPAGGSSATNRTPGRS
jgi:S-adenosylmethionine:tRNA ribosyltransferase-isomerase